MVNHGVSRACETCRRRKLKCDERRPACMRCTIAHRVCFGYRNNENLEFRYYVASNPPANGAMDFQHINQHALETFLKDYVVTPADSDLSRGFLVSLPSLLGHTDTSSSLAQAAQLVANANLGNRMNKPNLLDEARRQYVSLLCALHRSLSHNIQKAPVEALATVVLLGLYEILTSSENASGHVAHVRGVGAILLERTSPFDLSSSIQLFQVANPLIIKHPLGASGLPGALCAPGSHQSIQSLDSILVQCQPLFLKASAQLQDLDLPHQALEHTFGHAVNIEQCFSRWIMDHAGFWSASLVGLISQTAAKASSCPYCRPGPVHAYLDVYVAAVVNTYRKTRLMLLEILCRMAHRLNRKEAVLEWEKQSNSLIEDILASIPYHLASDPHAYLTFINAGTTPPNGRPVGGLLLLHPLYVLATCTAPSSSTKHYVLRCLAWIGEHMGIGQANLMAKEIEKIPFQQMAEGHILIWAGMLI